MHKVYIYIAAALFSLAICAACSKDEPQRAPGIIHTGPRDEENAPGDEGNTSADNLPSDPPGSGDIDKKEGIIGEWFYASGEQAFVFHEDNYFTAVPSDGMGFGVHETYEAAGTYVYDEMKRHLWLSVEGFNKEVYFLEFRCLIEQNKMTLYTLAGKEFILWKK